MSSTENLEPSHELKISGSHNKIWVSCACRAEVGKHAKAGKLTFNHIDSTRGWEETVKLYNDPENHWAPFDKKDEIGGKSRRR